MVLTRMFFSAAGAASVVVTGSGSASSAAATGRGSDELQPETIPSSPESRKKGTIMRDLGVFELFIFIFIPRFILVIRREFFYYSQQFSKEIFDYRSKFFKKCSRNYRSRAD